MQAPQKRETPLAGGEFAKESTDEALIISPLAPDAKTFSTMAAKFAIKGHALERKVRAGDGHITFTVGRWGHSRCFSHWNDVVAFYVQIGGAA